jgi:HlyD family secretion protein
MKTKISRWVIFIPVIIASAAVVVLIVRAVIPDKDIITGMVEVDEIDVASKIPGRIDSLFVQEGDKVVKGQRLAKLGSKEIDAKVEQARGAMEAARAKMEMAQNGARPEEKEAVEKQYMQTVHQFDLAEKTFARVQKVYQDSVISTQERDQVEFQYNAAKEQMDAAKAKYQMVLKGARKEEVNAAEALFHQAENGYNEAMAYQQEAELISPIDGEISKKITSAGEMAASGYPLFTVINPDDVWIVVQLREDKIAKMKIGSPAKAIIPALGNDQYFVHVTYIAAMADFATWKATNQKGDFDLKTFEIHLRPEKPIPGLRSGMTARVEF